MKYATFRHAGRVGVGVPTPGEDHPQPLLSPGGTASRDLLAWLEHPVARHHPA